MTAPPSGVQDSSFQLFLESIPDGFFAVDQKWKIVSVNSEGERVARRDRTELLGEKLWDIFPGAATTAIYTLLTKAAEQQTTIEFEYLYDPWEVWYRIKASPALEGGLSLFFEDITARKLIEQERSELLNRESEAREEAEALNEISRALSSELDSQKLVQLVTDRATKLTGAKFGAFFYNVLNDRGESYFLYTLSGASRESFDKFGMPRNTPIFDTTFRGTGVLRSDDITKDPRYGTMSPHHGMPKGHLPVRSYLAVPVIGRQGTVLGGLFFAHPTPGVFTERSERLAVGIASHAALAIDNAHLLRAAELGEKRFRGIFNSSSIGVAVLDTNTRFRQANPAFCAITGYTEQELLGLDWSELTHPDDRAAMQSEIHRLLVSEMASFSLEERYYGKDDRIVWVRNSVSVMRDAAGKPENLIILADDITERKTAARTSNLLSAIVDSSDDAIISKDLSGIITSWNKGAERIFGYTAEEIVGESVLKLIPEERHSEEPVILARLQSGRNIDHFETIRRRKDARLIDVSLTVSPVKDAQGHIIGASKIARDITHQKAAEEALLQSEARFRQLANAMPQMVWSTRSDGYTDYYNERWYEFTGFARNVFGPDSWRSIVHPEDLPVAHSLWAESIATGQTFRVVYRLRDRHENRWRWFMGTALPARDHEGNIVRWYGTCTDIDEQKQREDELRQANGALEQFAFSASHDLQEPLRTIKIYSELLTERHSAKITGEAVEFLNYLRGAATRMELLVRDLLNYTQISRLDMPKESTDANDALSAALANLQEAIDESSAQISVEPLPALRVNRTHLRQLFQNIIGNAVKYRSPERTPQVRVDAERRNDMWTFSVKDNGIGIEPEYKEQIFGLFKRLHSPAHYAGTGIGLAICQRIVERYNGRIWVESEPGQGSTFLFTLPV